jgi:hypothetical protein
MMARASSSFFVARDFGDANSEQFFESPENFCAGFGRCILLALA